jgi:hypothetical protein
LQQAITVGVSWHTGQHGVVLASCRRMSSQIIELILSGKREEVEDAI